MNATNADDDGVTRAALAGICARPAYTKHTITSAKSATAFTRLVARCVKSPSRVPRINSRVKMVTSTIAIGDAISFGHEPNSAADSPKTSAIAPVDAQVEIQST